MSMNLVSPNQSSCLHGGLQFKVSFSMKPSILRANSRRVGALKFDPRKVSSHPFPAANHHQSKITDGKLKFFEEIQRRKGLQISSSVTPVEAMTVGEYEVFLSFRGAERKRFVDHLYCSLDEVGVRAFRDREEILEGEHIGGKIIRAISSSRVCIPILSKGYADSAWCLRELTHMVECSKSTQLVILPIFLDVDPSEVKLYQGSYVQALRTHGIRFDPNTVQQWKDALKQVGKIKGWELEKEVNG